MFRLKLLNQARMVLRPTVVLKGAALTATATMIAAGSMNVVLAAKPASQPPPPPPPPPPADCDPNKPLLRAKELPLYSSEDEKKQTQEKSQDKCNVEDAYPDDNLMALVRAARQSVSQASDEIKKMTESMSDTVSIGTSHFNSSLQQLRDPANANVQYGAIAGGGLLGFIVGIRGGIIKKLVYTTAGALAVASVCYPDEADRYSAQVGDLVSEYGSIAYHFLNAAVKDLTGVSLTVPEFSKVVPLERLTAWISASGDEVSKGTPSSASSPPPHADSSSHLVATPFLSAGPDKTSTRSK